MVQDCYGYPQLMSLSWLRGRPRGGTAAGSGGGASDVAELGAAVDRHSSRSPPRYTGEL